MGVKERKERERQRRSHEILEAARRQFEEKGFINTTLQDVAQEAEISVGLIYRYFQSKEDMFASLALKGAEAFDSTVEKVLEGAEKRQVAIVLAEIAQHFYEFYEPYGEYFDLLIYSIKGRKDFQIRGTTLTSLMSVTLSTLDMLKDYILTHPKFRAQDEDEALRVVFLLWGILLGCHKLFDSSGRGHLFAYNQRDFVRNMIEQVLTGISSPDTETIPKKKSSRSTIQLPSSGEIH